MRSRITFCLVVLAGAGLLACRADEAPLAPIRAEPPPTAGLPPPPAGETVGVCEGQICGPSGAFSVADFPTIAPVDFAAFPANPPRPYQPADGGRAWYVSPEGDDQAGGTVDAPLASPQRALDMAASGDVVWLAAGEYRVGGDESEALTLRTPGLTLAADQPGAVTFRPANNDVAVGINAEADDLVVDGFVLSGFREYGVTFGRLDSPQRNLVLKHLVIEGSEDAIRSAIPESAPNPQPVVQGMLLYDVWLRGNQVIGFNCGEGPCADLRLEALRVEMPRAGDGGSFADAVAVEDGDNVVVFNADIGGAGADGLDFKATRVAVANVVVHDIGRNGVKLWHDGDVINALVYNTGADAAVVFDQGGRYRLLNVTVARHAFGDRAYAATVAYDAPTQPGQLEVVNTIFYQNAGALWVSPAFALDVRHALFFGSPGGEEITWGDLTLGENFETFAALEAAGGGCCNLEPTDPLFADPDAGDYRLTPGSPAIDAGTGDAEAFPDFDLLGGPRVNGTAVDLGPLEGN